MMLTGSHLWTRCKINGINHIKYANILFSEMRSDGAERTLLLKPKMMQAVHFINIFSIYVNISALKKI